MKLLLSSFGPSDTHDAALADLVGKPLDRIRVAYIENAYDVYADEATLGEGQESLRARGYRFELVDLREWRTDAAALRTLLRGFDAFLVAGGNPYYLRSLMKVTGADRIITDLVQDGAIYAGASAAAVVAGPTLAHFEELDDPSHAEQLVMDGLHLTNVVVAPHIDNADFGAGCRKAADALERDGYTVQRLTDAQALVIDGDLHRLV